jgi:hypothetical protein
VPSADPDERVRQLEARATELVMMLGVHVSVAVIRRRTSGGDWMTYSAARCRPIRHRPRLETVNACGGMPGSAHPRPAPANDPPAGRHAVRAREGTGMQEQQWITARRSELGALAERLTKQLQVERDELAIAERVLNRLAEQAQADIEAVAPVSAQVAGRSVLLVPHRSDASDEGALPGDYRKILAIVREADSPVQVRAVGERLGLGAPVRGRLEPMRAKMIKIADRGWLHKRPDGRFTARP